MLVSTFELLVKPQLPAGLIPPPPAALSRTVIQGYFLTIANTNNFNVSVSLVFTSITPTLDEATTATFLDTAGNNIPGDVATSIPGKTKRFRISIRAHDTVLFILQPDPALLSLGQELEVRGYVEIFLSRLPSPSLPSRRGTLLLTPEQRGTFFKDLTAADPQLDQIIYNLPTATGGALFEFNGDQFDDLPNGVGELPEEIEVLQR